jgi:hypothetical protein
VWSGQPRTGWLRFPLDPLTNMKRIVILVQIAVAVFVLMACTTTHTSPKQWSHITEGAARAELVRELGEPASRSQNVDTWFANGWQLRVMYNEGARATNLVQELIMR